ncbi:TIGR02594 family protein [Ancylobacter sp. Lp-2]|uniref:TIGR02594 family protein n=1 Tax=Ancylobacter sp. Lp-2 TaxID=2881339 RepID=UPI001E593ADF|nr:TIGR02594 family protein [Ancylobacter sp. Lp-2]MCB4767962.1 TIGR02594 family protein [Ancylobacter sp. Lp-2]
MTPSKLQKQPSAPGNSPGAAPTLPWIEEARRHLGLREIKGPTHAPAILRMLEALDAPFRDDEAAWCGTFAGWCIAAGLPHETLPPAPWGSINWLKFGIELKTPAYGCVAVFWHGAPSSWQGHVGFLVGQDRSAWHVLGGNQSDAVTVTRLARSRLRPGGLRWPAAFAAPAGPLPRGAGTGALSVNEA